RKEVAISAAPHHAMGRDAAVYGPPRPGPLHHLPRERQLQQKREAVSRPKKYKKTGTGDLFRARRHQIINMRQELMQLAGKIDWDFIDGEIAPRAAVERNGRPGIATRFVIGFFAQAHSGMDDRWHE